jgi:hypothetical protein
MDQDPDLKFRRWFGPGEEINNIFTDINMLSAHVCLVNSQIIYHLLKNVSIKQDPP